MPATTSSPRSAVRLLTAALAAVLLSAGGVAIAAPANAHDALIASDPAADSTVDALPAQLTLTFSSAIDPTDGASQVQVTDAAGTMLTSGAPVALDDVLSQPLEGAASGVVTVLWKVVSSDGHPTSGEFSFTVTAPEPTPTPTASATPTMEPTPTVIDEDPNMTVDPVATLFANLLPVLIVAALAALVITFVVAARRRRGGPSEPGSGTPADR